MRTRIHIDDLRVSCLIGCYPSERERTQEINVLIELDVDAREAAYEDSLAHPIDYMAIERSVRFVLQAGAFRLLETAGHVWCEPYWHRHWTARFRLQPLSA